jgi:hypothetical protein
MTGTQSQLGDQLARVALSVLVFTRTGSGLLTAATYALTFLPAVVGGILLAGLADTRPRRTLLVSCDALRAGLYGLMAIPSMPLWVVCGALIVAVLVGAPYNAAEPAVIADIYEGSSYQTALGLRTATSQAAQLIGFAAGGLVVALTGSHVALLIDAATFALSAVVLRALLTPFPAVTTHARGRGQQFKTGIGVIAGDPRLKVLLGFAWLSAWWVIPEGLAAPYAAAHGGGATSVGILLAANPTGNLIGTVVLSRWVPAPARARLLGVLGFAAGIPLAMCGLGPPIWLAAALWGVCGLLTCYLVVVIPEFVAIVPARVRGQTIGLAGSSLVAAQGVGLLIGGVAAKLWGTDAAIALAGCAGSLLALPLIAARRAQRTAQGAVADG